MSYISTYFMGCFSTLFKEQKKASHKIKDYSKLLVYYPVSLHTNVDFDRHVKHLLAKSRIQLRLFLEKNLRKMRNIFRGNVTRSHHSELFLHFSIKLFCVFSVKEISIPVRAQPQRMITFSRENLSRRIGDDLKNEAQLFGDIPPVIEVTRNVRTGVIII